MTNKDLDWEGNYQGDRFPKGLLNKSHRPSVYALLVLVLAISVLSGLLYRAFRTNTRLKNSDIVFPDAKRIGIISDIHLDMEQNLTVCKRSVWPHLHQVVSHFSSPYGADYCDSTYDFVELTIQALFKGVSEGSSSSSSSYEMVLHLGDQVGHIIDGPAGTINAIREVTQLIQLYNTHQVPVYLTLGNNDVPYDYVQPRDPVTWYTTVWDVIVPLFHRSALQLTNARDTFTRYGYYRINHSPDLWIVSMNTVLLSRWSNVTQTRDLAEQQFHWVAETLSQARRSRVRVYLIGHISPILDVIDDDLTSNVTSMTWRSEHVVVFRRLLRLYSDVVAFSFFSHEHTDIFFASRDMWGYMFPAVTSYSGGNPAWTVGFVDPHTWGVLDFWFYLSPKEVFSRLGITPEYLFHYSFKKSYARGEEHVHVINGTLLGNVASRVINTTDMMRTFNLLRLRTLQLHHQPLISAYQMFCIITCVSPDAIQSCLSRFLY